MLSTRSLELLDYISFAILSLLQPYTHPTKVRKIPYFFVFNFWGFPKLILFYFACSVCTEDGTWSGSSQSPSCSPINCGYPPKLHDGELHLLNKSTILHSLAAYQCSESFKFNSSADKGNTLTSFLFDLIYQFIPKNRTIPPKKTIS